MDDSAPRETRGIARLATHIGMALAAMAFASWWMTNTVYDTARTRRVAEIVLASADLRDYVAGRIAPVVAGALPQAGTPGAAPVDPAKLATGISDALGRADVQHGLAEFVGELHDRVIGVGSGPVVLAQPIVQELAAAADPQLSLADVAEVPAASVPIPRQQTLTVASSTFRSRWPWYALGAVIALVVAFVLSSDRRSTVRLVGRWLVGISAVQLVVLYLVPVWIVPNVTSNPWAGLVAAVVREWGASLVTGLALIAAAGVACLLVDRLIPPASGPAGSTSAPNHSD